MTRRNNLDNFSFLWKEFSMNNLEETQDERILQLLCDKLNIDCSKLDASWNGIELVEDAVAEVQDKLGHIPLGVFAPLCMYTALCIHEFVGGRIVLGHSSNGYGPVVISQKHHDCWKEIYHKLFCNNESSSYKMIVEDILYS